jgi:pyruvate/2-oxoglutarate dehydrogenase complex dihydrolipoamide dehydrogenase (E3) component
MQSSNTTVVIGAGPYGLSVAAHLKGQGVPTMIFGKTMEFWQQMPAKMYLKSVWTASTFSDPEGAYSLNQYAQQTKTPRQEPIPLPYFLDYGHWFQQHAVPEVDPTYVQSLSRAGTAFQLELADGRSITAERVVVAVGVATFPYVPAFADGIPDTLVSHTQHHKDFASFSGKKVIVVGTGQSGLETAALLHEAGADVELLARHQAIWIDRRLYRNAGAAKHIFYPPSDVGPPGINQLTARPLLFRHLPAATRDKLSQRSIRPAGADWLRSRVENIVKLTPFTQITQMRAQGDQVFLQLSDGTTREVAHVFLGTGYRPDLSKLTFIQPELRAQVQVRNGFPILSKWLESSVPNLSFVGAIAGDGFGPICRFVAGSHIAAKQVAQGVARKAAH